MLSKKVAYAIRCLVYLSSRNEPVLIREISDDTGMPRPFLAKIVNTLTRKGFLNSQRGIGGGISLSKKPELISMCDICIALDDPLLDDNCIVGLPDCSVDNACALHSFWSKQKERIIKYLEVSTIATLATTNKKAKKDLLKEGGIDNITSE